MSDPTLNRWFQRRWVELPGIGVLPQPAKRKLVDQELELTGLALLKEWRRQRDRVQPVSD